MVVLCCPGCRTVNGTLVAAEGFRTLRLWFIREWRRNRRCGPGALRDQIGLVPSEQYPDIAADLLMGGCDSSALRELAGYPRSDPRGARDLWIQARQELGKPFEGFGKGWLVLGSPRNWITWLPSWTTGKTCRKAVKTLAAGLWTLLTGH